jgi:hypothetical protein
LQVAEAAAVQIRGVWHELDRRDHDDGQDDGDDEDAPATERRTPDHR